MKYQGTFLGEAVYTDASLKPSEMMKIEGVRIVNKDQRIDELEGEVLRLRRLEHEKTEALDVMERFYGLESDKMNLELIQLIKDIGELRNKKFFLSYLCFVFAVFGITGFIFGFLQ